MLWRAGRINRIVNIFGNVGAQKFEPFSFVPYKVEEVKGELSC